MMQCPIFLFIGNGDYRNLGCQAIMLGTVNILKKAFGDDITILDMPNMNEPIPLEPLPPQIRIDVRYSYSPVKQRKWKRFNRQWAIRNILRIFPQLRRKYIEKIIFDKILVDYKESIEKATVVMSLGGDNYSLDYGVPLSYLAHGLLAKDCEKPFVVWGASVGPFDKEPAFAESMIKHLKGDVTHIFVREARSKEYLLSHGLKNVTIMSDPAFVMEPEKVTSEVLGFEIPENAIGINLSPLMAKFCTSGDIAAWEALSTKILEAVRENFPNPMVLIPHVLVADKNNDYVFMEKCLSRITNKSDIYLIKDCFNAQETKWIISKLGLLIAARTHATIAAFSSFVPTISLAYSVKAYGINEMIFGHSDFVIPPEKINSESVVCAIRELMGISRSVASTLRDRMSLMRQNAFKSGDELKNLISKCD